ncbi:MAG TPA: glycosyltransferase family 2 protein [Smithellaceae bacterium]|nr:glycosyltransferase family 2 protein [Smithellaceae bacterium]
MRFIIPLIFWLVGLFLLWRVKTPLSREDLSVSAAQNILRVSVIIPARNEAKKIGRLLESLKAQSVAPLEVIVVDDESSDNTALIAQACGVQVIKSKKIPAGWLGKPWACWQGARAAGGDALLFLDADTWLARNGLENIVRKFREKGGFLSVQPYHVTEKLYEQLSAFFNIVVMAGFNAFTILGEKIKPTGGFGPCAICLRDDYFALGGHAAVKDSVIENSVLGGIFLSQGHPVSCYGGKSTISFRMYPDGLKDLFWGWSKSFAAGSASVSKITFLLIILWVTGCFEAFILPAKAILAGKNYKELCLLSIIYLLFAGQLMWMLRQIGKFQKWTALLYPLPLIFFVFVMFWSVLQKTIFRKTKWKDRVVEFKS